MKGKAMKTIRKCSPNVKEKGHPHFASLRAGVEKIAQFCLNDLMEGSGHEASG
jgi:hypothetical protein